MAVKVGINGFGRIGRVVFRTCLQNPEIQVSAINDPAIDAEYVCYLMKFDSTHGKFKGSVIQTEDGIKVNGRLIKVFHEKLPATVPWQTVGVQYVVEASGMFTCLEKASGHLASDSVKRVIITAPSVDVPMIILGVNDNKLNARQKVLSCASSTLYCLAPIIKVLEDKYGVSEGFITSIHAMTPSLKPLDGLCLRGKHWRDHRSIHQNIIPATTGACKALGKIIPRVKDKMTGLAFRVPIVNVSVLDITVRLETNTTLQEIFRSVEKASKSDMENIIKLSTEQAVSSDFFGDSHSCILDADSSLQLKPDFFKMVCWYENEYSYACRIIDSIFFSEKQFNQQAELLSSITFVRQRPSRQERDRKEISLNCSCNSEISTKILCSTSQDTGFKSKPTSRPIILRKPISSHTSHTVSTCNRETKKRNEIFKIWNDSIDAKDIAARQNRGSFFHTFIATEPQKEENADCVKTQERLKNVKKEFSKMVSITEDLLRKSGSNKFKFSSLATTSKEDVDCGNVELDANYLDQPKSDSYVEKNNTQISNHILDVCGDCKNSFGVTNIAIRKSSKSDITTLNKPFERTEFLPQYMLYNAEKREIKKNKDLSITNSSLDTFIRKRSEKTAVMSYEAPEDNAEISDSSFDFKEQVAKTITTLIDGLSQNIQEHHDVSYHDETIPIPEISNDVQTKELVADEVVTSIIETSETETAEKKTCDTQTVDLKKTHTDKNILNEVPEKYNLKDFVKYLQNENYNMRIIDEELKKRNIVLVNSPKYDTNSELFRPMERERLTVERDNRYADMDFKKRLLEGLNKLTPEPVILIPEDASGCESPGNTATTLSNAGSKRYKQDIYDKLDSTSATDSNDSFEIKERKSQVIHITDLTNSLEDLARLDKICRIIEISDELSDKLFSALDNYDSMQLLQKKKWSFKDFCEKIKLDDFCNKVFGKAV